MTKTIFITLFQGVEAKNILRTDIYNSLISNKNIKLIFFVSSEERVEYYKKEFSNPNVIYEVVKLRRFLGLNKFFSNLSFRLLNTKTVELRKKMALEIDRKYLEYYFDYVLNKIIARPFFRNIFRCLDYRFAKNDIFSDYFEKYKPSLVFLAHLFDDLEISLLKEAKKRGVKTVGFINSWDKLTARNIIRVLPDKLLVFNNIVKKEAIDYADMKEKNVEVVGVPQYDWHLNYMPLSKEVFFSKKGFNLNKKLIVYAPMGKTYSGSDWDIIDFIHNEIESGGINSQLLVRFQPNDFVDMEEVKKRPWLVYDIPGIRFSNERGVDWDMSFEDIRSLTDTLANADLFICYASSMSIDAAIFNKPVINIDFEIGDKKYMIESPTYFYKTTHYSKAAKTGAIFFPKNKADFLETINKLLENPKLNSENREKLVQEQCFKIDGKSAERVANFILTNI